MSYVMYVYIRPASQLLQEHTKKDKTAENQNELKEFKYFPKFLLDSKVNYRNFKNGQQRGEGGVSSASSILQ